MIIIAMDSLDVDLADSVEQAQSLIEPQDVNVTKVFDADGCVCKLEILKGGWIGPDLVKIEATEEFKPDEAKKALFRYLRVLAVAVEDNASLESMISLLKKRLATR